MIELASLFLGFVLGVHPVELAVDARVASVAILLDGREVARLEAPPWSSDVDFGSALEPHRLEALAFDAEGRELDRARSLINYARGDYRASLVLDAPDPDRPGGRTGRLIWAAVLRQDPVRVDLRFDGGPLPLEAGGRFVLPSYDPEESHFLEAELTFADRHVIRTELSFGGRFGDRVTSALTAVPISSPAGRAWSIDEVRGWLVHGGRGVKVFAARAEEGRLLLVRSERVGQALNRRSRHSGSRSDVSTGLDVSASGVTTFDVTAISPRPLKAFAGTFELRSLGRPADRHRLELSLTREDLRFGREKKKKKEHLWDALALAGRHAASSNRPRVVLLMVGREVNDHSVITLSQALHYLDSVRVPLLVWAPDPEPLEPLGLDASERSCHGVAGLEEIGRRVAVELASQTIVWLEGEYLPDEVALGEMAPPEAAFVR